MCMYVRIYEHIPYKLVKNDGYKIRGAHSLGILVNLPKGNEKSRYKRDAREIL